MNLNVDAQKKNTYDAIVVGSGISGGWAAKELCENGLNVLMLERGKNVVHPDYPTATKSPWEFPHRGRLTQEDREQCYVQSRHFSYQEDNKHFYINDLENPYEEIKRFDWVRGDIVGGRSLLWGRLCYRWSDLDFDANAKDAIGVDWPIRYKDISPWYDYVESFIGVSGRRDGIPHLPDGKFLPPMEMNCVEDHFRKQIEEKFPGRRVTIGRPANLTEPLKGRGQCQNRNLCHRGCPYGAYFSTNSSTLPAAFETGKLTLMPQSMVNSVIYDQKKNKAIGVEVLDMETGSTNEFYSRIIFLNAATLATTFILLHSTSSRFPNGLGNGSDQVGRNLMDHHKCNGLSAEFDGFKDRYYSGRRPCSIYVPRFKNLYDHHADFIRGYGFLGGASREGANRSDERIGAGLKKAMQMPGTWKMNFTGFGECLPYANNRVTLHQEKKDHWGRPQLSVDCEFKENERAMQRDMASEMATMMESAGLKNISIEPRMSFPGNANHEMGTARMGRDPRTSVLNAFNQMHEVPQVFITDGSCMTSSACVNPSLTYMALTARACHFAIGEMKKGKL
jgi:choline dehydrogenase-like flavoprotein